MPLPLFWLGAGLATLVATDRAIESARNGRGRVRHYPGEGKVPVKAQSGAIVCCGIYGMFDHTGIWVDDSVVELRGNGLIRGISPERFLHNRSGEKIYLLCDLAGNPLIAKDAASRAAEQLFQYSEYHVMKNNCHRFVWRCVSGINTPITSFHDLNQSLHQFFACPLSWQPLMH